MNELGTHPCSQGLKQEGYVLEVNLTELHSNVKVSLGYTATSCLQRKWWGRGQNVTAALLMRAANRMNQVHWQWQGTVSRYNANEFQSEG